MPSYLLRRFDEIEISSLVSVLDRLELGVNTGSFMFSVALEQAITRKMNANLKYRIACCIKILEEYNSK